MKTITKFTAGLLLIVLISCTGERINQEQTTEMLMGYEKGLIAGIDLGDNWDDIKANHHEEWTVREEHTVEEFEGETYENTVIQLNVPIDHYPLMMGLTFDLNEQNNIIDIGFFIKGMPEDKLYLTKLYKKMQNEFSSKFEFVEENNWIYTSPAGEKCPLTLSKNEFTKDKINLSIYLFTPSEGSFTE